MPDLGLDDVLICAGRHSVKFIGLAASPDLGHESAERRIVSRFSLPLDAARALYADLADALREDGGYGVLRAEVVRAQARDKTLDH